MDDDAPTPPVCPPPGFRQIEIFTAFLRLGLTAFGGPVAHLGFFHEEFVRRRRWLDENAYADLVALCQFLPGPASSQVGMALGLRRAGLPGMGLAWLGFTLPSAILMIAFAYGMGSAGAGVAHAGWLRGLKLAAVAVVAQAVWTMAQRLCPDRARVTVALLAAAAVLVLPTAGAQVLAIAAGALAGRFLLPAAKSGAARSDHALASAVSPPSSSDRHRARSVVALVTFLALLAGLPLLARLFPGSTALRVGSGFYRAGSLVFGGGHVILPLLQAETVVPGWISPDRFLAGYGAAQAIPGPLTTFAGYLGASLPAPLPHGWGGGLLCLAAIFLPSALLVLGTLPFWEDVRHRPDAQAALRGANAAVVGVLLAALYQPVWTSAVHGPNEFVLGLLAFGLLVFWRRPPWLVVLLAAAAGQGWLR
jgi:chromate transporter